MGRPLTGARCQTTASATELGWRYTLGQPFGRAPSQPALGSSVQVQKRLKLGGISNKSIWTCPPSATLPFTVHPSNPIRHRRLSRVHRTQAADGQYHSVDFAPSRHALPQLHWFSTIKAFDVYGCQRTSVEFVVPRYRPSGLRTPAHASRTC